MSRTKSTGLIKAVKRPKSDAGHAGWRPKVGMVESAKINGAVPPALVSDPVLARAVVAPIDPGSPREVTKAPTPPAVEAVDPRQLGLFASLGVVV